MEPRSGRLLLVEPLDHELERDHLLTIGLRHKQSLTFTRLRITVRPLSAHPACPPFDARPLGGQVEDVNDHAPRFVRSMMEGRVEESAAVGSLVAVAAAFDPDSGLNGLLHYSILSGFILPPSTLGSFFTDFIRLAEVSQNGSNETHGKLSMDGHLDLDAISRAPLSVSVY